MQNIASNYIGFEVLAAVVTKTFISWDIIQRSPLKSIDVSEELVASTFMAEE
jgi:hypothetical protein